MSAMRAERFGSYSIAVTSAATPCLRLLKSILRYFCLWPPPMCRAVNRPLLFRPPLLFFTSVKLLCGLFAEVTSGKAGSDLKRRTGVSGRKLLSAIKLDEIDLLALLQGYDRFLPMWFAAEISAAFALLFARVIGGIHRHDLLVEEPLDRLFDLDLVCARRNAEHVLVQLLAQQRRLLG